ncbi:resolvase [Microvirga ossetica]|uniref:Resolvase n=1 Tax=Microvirga ossetica TaxID=1882682 RepID=A0A1B2EDP0_9HYPH|nr:recombinase family protein [Microvirga ossetica]ANY78073.1 resolvase [Microvirga ossetica]
MATYSYSRVSTLTQANEGESLGAQQRRIEGYSQMIDTTVDEHFVEEGVSGSVPFADRPRGGELMAKVKVGDTVIVTKLDRCFRSADDALNVLRKFKEKGVALHMMDLGGDVTSNGVSKLVFTILSAVAEQERDRTKERITEVKQDQKKRNRFLGGSVPFGFMVGDDGELIEKEDEQDAIKTMIELKADGFSYRGIAKMLQKDGFNISHETVGQIVKKQLQQTV